MTATTLAASASTLACPEPQAARPEGLHRLVMVFGMALADWARKRADQKAMARDRHPLSALSDHERATLYREATQLREQTYAGLGRWHVTG